MSFIVELETGVWLAEINGDPGRTLVEADAQQWDSYEDALGALAEARKLRPFERASVIQLDKAYLELNHKQP